MILVFVIFLQLIIEWGFWAGRLIHRFPVRLWALLIPSTLTQLVTVISLKGNLGVLGSQLLGLTEGSLGVELRMAVELNHTVEPWVVNGDVDLEITPSCNLDGLLDQHGGLFILCNGSLPPVLWDQYWLKLDLPGWAWASSFSSFWVAHAFSYLIFLIINYKIVKGFAI